MQPYPKEESDTWGRVLALQVSRLGFQQTLDEILARAGQRAGGYYCFANAHMSVEAWQRPAFAKDVNASVRVCPDGMPLIWAQRLLYGKRTQRVAGMDILPELLTALQETGLSVYFYGGAQEVLDALAGRLAQEWPSLQVAGLHSPPFRPLTPEEQEADIQAIRASGASVVVVALGCPKQETWMAQHSSRLDAVLLGLGGAVPVLAGAAKRAPRWMQRAGLEWFYRWLQEPRRLFVRYAQTNSQFIWQVLRQRWMGKQV